MISDETTSLNIKKMLNAADLVYERANMCFFYIGTDECLFEHFNHHFQFGHREVNLYAAGSLLQQLYLGNNRLPDVIFIDVSLNEEELNKFCSKLSKNLLLSNLPVIYNETHLTGIQVNKLRQSHLVDDIIAINSNRINYFSKVMFLKQSKLYNQLMAAGKTRESKKKKPGIHLSYIFKRITDIVIALSAILILLPVLLIITIAIKLESKGPVFYIALRAGKGFKVFKFYKFRSMIANADKQVDMLSNFNQYDTSSEDGAMFFKINNDPRITKFGRFLRNTSADELPQLLNVLKGDMSLVGNRPLPIYEAVTLTTNNYVERFNAPAGITGLWQVNKRGKADMSTEERINLDIAYSKNSNFLYDLKILVKTPVAIFQKSHV